eukprot:TRINITY_DN3979_c0_g1_i2.p1 TRINITY_DN3979_c0_g1~~TRINITY_DN3979_c0_g1_i2.p1  ORF type:complete len:211 (-),score=39.22 TRINITY_DN3979_c0_g1_i2:111-743(-)
MWAPPGALDEFSALRNLERREEAEAVAKREKKSKSSWKRMEDWWREVRGGKPLPEDDDPDEFNDAVVAAVTEHAPVEPTPHADDAKVLLSRTLRLAVNDASLRRFALDGDRQAKEARRLEVLRTQSDVDRGTRRLFLAEARRIEDDMKSIESKERADQVHVLAVQAQEVPWATFVSRHIIDSGTDGRSLPPLSDARKWWQPTTGSGPLKG